MKIDYYLLAVSTLLLSCSKGYEEMDPVAYQIIENPSEVTVEQIADIPYMFAHDGLLIPGSIDSSDDVIVLGFCGDSTTAGISAYDWEGKLLWSTEYGTYGYASAVCVDGNRVLFSVTDEIPVLDSATGEMIETISAEGLSDILVLPEAPDGQSMPDFRLAQGMEIQSEIMLWNKPECDLNFSYCGFLSDLHCSFQRYLRVTRIDGLWYIGMTEGHYERLSIYKVPDFQHSLRPKVFDIALTDTSVVAILSFRDMVMEFAFDGRLIRTTYFGHELEGPISFTYDSFMGSTIFRYLIADIDTDDEGCIYLLYSGYGVGQNGNAEIWKVNTVSLTASMARLDHSAVAFTICGSRAAVVEQQHEPGEGDEIVLTGTPSIHVYQIEWEDSTSV
ncbi:MAG: hypothetical protein KAR40_08530 [Candidatus Sabulitectum sp.]|nr:hypothetical protein [Candidatus Sabulitectum sp.]